MLSFSLTKLLLEILAVVTKLYTSPVYSKSWILDVWGFFLPLSASQKSQFPLCLIIFSLQFLESIFFKALISNPHSSAAFWGRAAGCFLQCCSSWLGTGSLMQDPAPADHPKVKILMWIRCKHAITFLCLIQNLFCTHTKARIDIFPLAQSLPIQSQPVKTLPTLVTQHPYWIR